MKMLTAEKHNTKTENTKQRSKFSLVLLSPQDCNGQIGGGGVSVYYSHTLQLLCFSYAHGKSFLAPLVSISKDVSILYFLFSHSACVVEGNYQVVQFS